MTLSPDLLEPSAPLPTIPSHDAPSITRQERSERTHDLLLRLDRSSDEREQQELLDQVVVLNLGVARAVASRYRARGLSLDDLQQVASLALVKAARGFDAHAGHDFLSYAVPTIRGEVRRHFRDHGWTVRPPRRIQELQAKIGGCESELAFRLGRSPRPSEVADHLGETLDDVLEALTEDGCFHPASLDKPVGTETETVLGDMFGEEDSGRDAAEARVVLAPVVRRLGERDRRILMLRFFKGWTQQEIADDIGVTQMQVSRLLSRILRQLRERLDGPGMPLST
ncbi:MAG: sigma-70 family RNA polymerase sigma factor [Nocardioidaceae bacterium]|nr:sigma-70 family RNA polymerase sigma factor [Nocardioidaceae bacterium]NUS50197.1 sigma-70 family RNA polymerase sigma factor [Nocardioidaceae bacterium]